MYRFLQGQVNHITFPMVDSTDFATPESALLEGIRASAVRVEGAHDVEKLLVRKTGHRLYVDLHLEVDPQMSVEKAHGIAHEVKDAIMRDYRQVANVLVHVEPAGHRANGGSSPGGI